VSELKDGNRVGCALAACDSTIYFLGGGRDFSRTKKSWNSFYTRTNKWASTSSPLPTGQYRIPPKLLKKAIKCSKEYHLMLNQAKEEDEYTRALPHFISHPSDIY